MLDIQFYMKAFELKRMLMNGKSQSGDYVIEKFESFRSKYPIVYNIETTNACNMRCEMCPRTTMMTRPIENLDMETYKKVIDQLKPFAPDEWKEWERFVEENYHISKQDMSENHFFLHIIPKVLVLHGYGDPLLDKDMPERIRLLAEKKIPSYFSCNPANINLNKTIEMCENGLGFIKYSIESVDDIRHKEIRGSASNFTDSYRNILTLLEIKEKKSYQTTIVITMLNLNNPSQQEEFQELLKTRQEALKIRKEIGTEKWLLEISGS